MRPDAKIAGRDGDGYDFLVTVKAASHECFIMTDLPSTYVNAENEAWLYSKETV